MILRALWLRIFVSLSTLMLISTITAPVTSAAPIPRELPTWRWLEKCVSETDLDCIEALGVVTSDGIFLPGRPTGLSRPNPVRGSRELQNSGIFNGDGTHTNETWQLPGLKNEYGTEYVITEFTLMTGTTQWYDFPNDIVYPAPGFASAGAGILPVPTREGFANGLWGVPLSNFPYECVTQNFVNPMQCQREANLDPNQVIRAVIRYSWYQAGSVVSHLRDNVYVVEPITTGGTRVTIEGRPGERPYFMDSLALSRNYFDRGKSDALFYGWRINSTEAPDSFSVERCRSSGVPIMTGNMFSASTPIWRPTEGELSVNVWAPHLDPEGRPYRGYYEGNFPNDYISCMWGLPEQEVLTRFVVSVTEPVTGEPTVATMSLQKTSTGVRITAANFTYSTEQITFKRRAAGGPTSPLVSGSATSVDTQVKVKKTKKKITCIKQGEVRKITRSTGNCPRGWKRG